MHKKQWEVGLCGVKDALDKVMKRVDSTENYETVMREARVPLCCISCAQFFT